MATTYKRVSAWGARTADGLFAPFHTQAAAMAVGRPVAVVADVALPRGFSTLDVTEAWAEIEATDAGLWRESGVSASDRASPRSLVGGAS